MAQYSAARNESSFLSGKPDPRTGFFAKILSFGKISGNNNNGPHFPLTLSFDPQTPSSGTDSEGFGIGWGLSIPSFVSADDITGKGHLSLLSGEVFYIEPTDGDVALQGYALDGLRVSYNSSTGEFTVLHKSGAVELYQPQTENMNNAYLSEMTDEKGRKLSFSYTTFNGAPVLEEIYDNSGVLLCKIDTTSTQSIITITNYPGLPEESAFTLELEGGLLTSFYGPESYAANFEYNDQLLSLAISSVSDNHGLNESAQYSNEITQPGGSGNTFQTSIQYYTRSDDPNDPSSDYYAEYKFRQGEANYLGYPIITTTIEEQDSLLIYTPQAGETPFTYTTIYTERVSDTVNKTTKATYNRYHSIVSKIVSFDGDLADEDTSKYHTVTETYTYDVDETQNVDGQKGTYKKPTSYTKEWAYNGVSANEVSYFTWDTLDSNGNDAGFATGNLLSKTDKSGVKTDYTYYPVGGDGSNCPADPNGFKCHLKSKLITPAVVDDPSLPLAPTVQTDYTYASLSCYGGTGTYLARTQRKSSQNGVAIEAHDITYFNVDTDDLLTLGRLNTIVYTVYNAAPVGDKTTTSSFDYYLSEDSNTFFTEIEMSTNVDSEMTKHCYERKIYSGKVVYTANITESESAPALTIDITYDGLDRVTKKTACQGSEFEASQSFAYGNINSDDDDEDNATYFRRTSTDANGLQIRTYLNGSGKTLFQKQQDVDGIVGVGLFLQTQQISYDGLGNELSSTNYDYLPGDTATAPSISTITTIQYDVWGAECGTTYPDSHQEIDAHDPTTLTSEGYWLLSDKSTEQYTQTVYNISGSPVSESRLNLDGSIYSTTTTDYDGLGRSVRTTDAQNNVELTSYDAFSRPLTKTLPDGTEVQTTYAPHSKENLTTSIALAKDGDSYTFGTREFDGLSHTTTMSVGGRVTTLEYTANTAMPHPSFVNTPAGDRLKYTYQPELGYATMSIGLETGDGVGAEDEASMTYTYSPASGQPVTANSTKGASEYSNWTYEYLPSGETTSSSLTYALDSGEQGTKQISSTYSLCGLVLVTTDVQMQTHTVTYNGQGQQIGYQLQSGSQSLVEVEYSYDLSGRPSQTVTQDTLSGAVNQTTTISYDDQGRELTRTLSALGSSQSQTLAYSVDDQILTRTWMQDGAAYRTETYDYSVLKQLTSYECTGNAMPDAPDGYVLKEQTIIFDFLGNISTVTSTVTASANPGTDTVNVATYSYDPTDRTQLVSISNDPITDWDITLTYDANGNQTTDEQGRTLVYNSRNQLMSLSEDAQTLGGYNYDAYGFLLSEKVASDADATLLFYLDNQLINEVKGDVASTYVESLSCAVTDSASASTQVQLLGSDQQGSIVQISDASEVTYRIYDPYGYRKV